MRPPHWLCQNCGIIINDSGSQPRFCSYCGHSGFIYCGYEGEYDIVDIRAENRILFDPDKFTPEMTKIYWENFTEEEKWIHQRKIEELNEKIKVQNPSAGSLF
jgi:hypothetical protein